METKLNITELEKMLKFQIQKLRSLKFTHIASSIILIVLGAIILVGSISTWKFFYDLDAYLQYFIYTPTLVLFIGSIILIALGWSGIISVWQNVYRGILIFYISSCFLLVSTLVSWIYFYYNFDSLMNSVLYVLKEIFNDYDTQKKDVDVFQSKFHCCGINHYSDWKLILGYVPGSCCNLDEACYNFEEHVKHRIYRKGCYFVLYNIMNKYNLWLFIITCIVEGFLLLSIVLSYVLCRTLNEGEKLLNLYIQSKKNSETSISNNPLAQIATFQREAENYKEISNHQENNIYRPDYDYHNTHFWTPSAHTTYRSDALNYPVLSNI